MAESADLLHAANRIQELERELDKRDRDIKAVRQVLGDFGYESPGWLEHTDYHTGQLRRDQTTLAADVLFCIEGIKAEGAPYAEGLAAIAWQDLVWHQQQHEEFDRLGHNSQAEYHKARAGLLRAALAQAPEGWWGECTDCGIRLLTHKLSCPKCGGFNVRENKPRAVPVVEAQREAPGEERLDYKALYEEECSQYHHVCRLLDAEREKKADSTLTARIAELEAALEKVNARLADAQGVVSGEGSAGWISVKARLPEGHDQNPVTVIAVHHWDGVPTEDPTVGTFLCYYGKFYPEICDPRDDDADQMTLDNITHWMPIPAAPRVPSGVPSTEQGEAK